VHANDNSKFCSMEAENWRFTEVDYSSAYNDFGGIFKNLLLSLACTVRITRDAINSKVRLIFLLIIIKFIVFSFLVFRFNWQYHNK
jgi:hypothetical protein